MVQKKKSLRRKKIRMKKKKGPLILIGVLVLLLILYFAVCLYHRKYKYLVPGAASLALWLTELLGPVVLYRYVYPLVVATPVLIGALLTSARNGTVETETETETGTAGAEAPASIESDADTETADTEAPAGNKETDSNAKS